jgi:hypothetical protein
MKSIGPIRPIRPIRLIHLIRQNTKAAGSRFYSGRPQAFGPPSLTPM